MELIKRRLMEFASQIKIEKKQKTSSRRLRTCLWLCGERTTSSRGSSCNSAPSSHVCFFVFGKRKIEFEISCQLSFSENPENDDARIKFFWENRVRFPFTPLFFLYFLYFFSLKETLTSANAISSLVFWLFVFFSDVLPPFFLVLSLFSIGQGVLQPVFEKVNKRK